MKNETKKILDKLQKVANRETASRNALMEMKDKDYQLLLDYITNLQEENNSLKQMIKDTYDTSQEIMFELQEKIDKAIEYINHAQNYAKEKNVYVNGDNLLNILQGVDKE